MISSNMEFDIAYKEDIIKELSEKFGYSIEKTENNVNYILDKIREYMLDTETYSIKMKPFGSLHISIPTMERSSHVESKIGEERKKKLKKVEEYIKLGVITKRIAGDMGSIPRPFRRSYRRGLPFIETESIQNDV